MPTKLGEELSLRPLVESDAPNVCRWLASPFILEHSFVIPSPHMLPDDFRSQEYARRYFAVLINDQRRITFAILCHGVHVGNVGLKDISFEKGRAECFIEVGEQAYRGQGLGSMAMKKILNLAFSELGLSSLGLEVLEFNHRALKIYDRLGFLVKGFCGWHYDEFGQYWRVIKMGIERVEWLQMALKSK